MSAPLAQAVLAEFKQHFGYEPMLVRAPGRVNLIGEHTDYNGGYVLPAAIDKEAIFAVGLNGGTEIRLISHDLGETFTLANVAEVSPSQTHWANYLLGVVAQLQQRGVVVPGFDCVFGANIPVGAGMSSSAALECGLAFALNHLLHANIGLMELAHVAQKAEHTYAGVQCGLMDQFASLFGRAGQVVRLDCRSLEYAYFPFDTTASRIVLCNSGVKHSLATSAYNTRREECERGVAVLQQYYPAVQSLRDATVAQLDAHRDELGDTVYRRCAYVVKENGRVETGCRHLEAGDLTAFGQDMYASHAGLRDDYEVSCVELDALVEAARGVPGVYGSRMMGGGFGGCTINLVAPEHVDAFIAHVSAAYQQQFGRVPETYQTTIVAGVSPLAAAAQ
ncbi:galactokinase [Hymenobacter sp. BT770]|uniref:galactokinase n=1 Tax=Hymenobacter sp. BT770 TaxID=2886942 RepID=UPI001D10C3C5|nr:galactokinase [Hymenobacter sp. BT770]MCC3152085.1 galactokinase [Hymenobacter sp. BT770]MDO3415232.1 galactokinase [Hymenobacter sp. BT770]